MKTFTTEQNKDTIRNFFGMITDQGLDAALCLLSDDCTWWTPNNSWSKAKMSDLSRDLSADLDEPLVMEVGTITAEGDRVAVEVRSRARRKNGVPYANQYHFLFCLANGRITSVREHCDTAHAAAVWRSDQTNGTPG